MRDKDLKKFVHATCVRAQQQVAAQRWRGVPLDPEAGIPEGLPHGLTPKSLADYQIEWSRYTQFAQSRCREIPGQDVKWDMGLLWDYLLERSRTCKPTTLVQIATKLRHFGVMHGHVLATSKFDAKPGEYGIIRNMKRQLAIRARANARDAGRPHEDVDRCTPIGKRGIEMLLSAFEVSSQQAFRKLHRSDRHHIVAAAMQHTGGMRFGQFHERDYTIHSFMKDAKDGSFRLVTDYGRYAGRRQFCIEFPAAPRYESMWYQVKRADGSVVSTLTAAAIMGWHFDMLRDSGESHVFRPVIGQATSRDARQAWLRQAFKAALPVHESAARKLIDDMTPHSFRAGIAGDLWRNGHSMQTIAAVCRWNSIKAIRLYAERPCMSMFRTTTEFCVVTGTR